MDAGAVVEAAGEVGDVAGDWVAGAAGAAGASNKWSQLLGNHWHLALQCVCTIDTSHSDFSSNLEVVKIPLQNTKTCFLHDPGRHALAMCLQ